jgi:hypothetical protein
MNGTCGTYGREHIYIPGNLKESDGLEDLGVKGRIILKWILKKWNGKACTGSISRRIGTTEYVN